MSQIEFFGADMAGVPYAMFVIAIVYSGFLTVRWRRRAGSGWWLIVPFVFMASLAYDIPRPSDLVVVVLAGACFCLLIPLRASIECRNIIEALGLGVIASLMAVLAMLAESTSSRGQAFASYSNNLHEAAELLAWVSQSLAIIAMGAGALTLCFAIQRRHLALIRADEQVEEQAVDTQAAPTSDVSTTLWSAGRCSLKKHRH